MSISQESSKMVMRIPSPRKPVQLYVWDKCGFCVKQKKVLDSMNAEMSNWFHQNVTVTVVVNPKDHPTVKGYPYWVINGIPDPGFKTLQQVMAIRRDVS